MYHSAVYFRSLAARKLPFERFRHTVGVEVLARNLAEKSGIDPEAAALAALTHDLAKAYTIEEQLQKAEAWKLIYYAEDRQMPQVLHGRIAAHMLKYKYGVNDTDILNAVANHTLGRPGMSDLEMLIYSADLTEPGRIYPGVDKLREKLYDDLKEGTLACIAHTIEYLQNTDRLIHPLTIEAYNDLQRRLAVGDKP